MLKCDFNIGALQIEIRLRQVFPYKFTAYFWETFYYEHIWAAASENTMQRM